MTPGEEVHGGRCLCGAVRYQVRGQPKWTANCHCASCRRATGAPVVTYAGFASAQFAWLEGMPRRFSSSPGVTRSFCRRCGTPLTYEGRRWPGEVHIMVATLDEPERFPPANDGIFVGERLPWIAPLAGGRD